MYRLNLRFESGSDRHIYLTGILSLYIVNQLRLTFSSCAFLISALWIVYCGYHRSAFFWIVSIMCTFRWKGGPQHVMSTYYSYLRTIDCKLHRLVDRCQCRQRGCSFSDCSNDERQLYSKYWRMAFVEFVKIYVYDSNIVNFIVLKEAE